MDNKQNMHGLNGIMNIFLTTAHTDFYLLKHVVNELRMKQ